MKNVTFTSSDGNGGYVSFKDVMSLNDARVFWAEHTSKPFPAIGGGQCGWTMTIHPTNEAAEKYLKSVARSNARIAEYYS